MRRYLTPAMILGVLLLAAAPASGAELERLGKVAPSGAFPGSCGNCEAFAYSTAASSPSYVVPNGRWKIISWSAQGDTDDPAHARLRVYRPTGTTDQFKLVKQTQSRRFKPGEKSTYNAKIRVRPGDILGIETIGSMPIVYETGRSNDEIASPTCNPVLGDTVGSGTACSLNTTQERRVNVAATLKRRP